MYSEVGEGTGKETPKDKVEKFKEIIGDSPLIIGSGMNISNVDLLNIANGAIVGSSFKPNGTTTSMVDKSLVLKFMSYVG
jgi:predicted TIM-barrel enzyme